jgi:hypothetical protein
MASRLTEDQPKIHGTDVEINPPPPIPYVDDVEERLEIARTLQNRIRSDHQRSYPDLLEELEINQDMQTFSFNLMQMAVFFHVDIRQLRNLKVRGSDGKFLASIICRAESFLANGESYAEPHGITEFTN